MNKTLMNILLCVVAVGIIYECGYVESSDCLATADYDPVCGSDGNTYGNYPSLLCAQQDHPNLKYSHPGTCGTCHWIDQGPPVCGTDGQKYTNSDHLRCAQQQKPGLRLAHNGAC